MQATWLDKHFKGDRTIWLIVFILSIFSLLAVYSSTGTLAYKYQSGNTEYYLIKHLIILAFGLALMYGAHLVKYTYYSRISQVALMAYDSFACSHSYFRNKLLTKQAGGLHCREQISHSRHPTLQSWRSSCMSRECFQRNRETLEISEAHSFR